MSFRRVKVIDSHTGGEPTRVVISGGPNLGHDALSNRVARFRGQHDDFRCAVVNEPRGSEAVVGALLCPPVDDSCVTGVIFFNSVAYLGMCGHGTIGVVATMAHLNRIGAGAHRIETSVGVVVARLDDPRSEVVVPQAIRHHAGEEGVVATRDPLGQPCPSSGIGGVPRQAEVGGIVDRVLLHCRTRSAGNRRESQRLHTASG